MLCDRCTNDMFYCKVANFKNSNASRIISSTTNQQHHFLFTNPTESQKSINSATASHVRRWFHAIWKTFLVFITSCWASNTRQPVMFCKDWKCIRPSPLQYTIYYEKKCYLFTLVLHFTLIYIRLVVWNEKSQFVWNPWSALACVLFKKYGRAFSLPIHVRCGRHNELWKNRVCGKIYPACKANDDIYTAKNSWVSRWAAAAYCTTCHWLQNGVSIIKYATGATISTLEIHHRR